MDFDNYYKNTEKVTEDFNFDEKVSAVFDDMAERSIPFYSELQKTVLKLSESFYQDGSWISDFGCATGTTLEKILSQIPKAKVEGIDSSKAMLQQAENKLKAFKEAEISLVEADLDQGFGMKESSICLMLFTLQFIRPINRELLLSKIYSGMRENGILIVAEKIISSDSSLSRVHINHHLDFKKSQGYSEMEIALKREALENVLVPYTLEENVQILRKAGFSKVDSFFRWFNFAAFMAVK